MGIWRRSSGPPSRSWRPWDSSSRCRSRPASSVGAGTPGGSTSSGGRACRAASPSPSPRHRRRHRGQAAPRPGTGTRARTDAVGARAHRPRRDGEHGPRAGGRVSRGAHRRAGRALRLAQGERPKKVRENPGGYLVASIREDYATPEGFASRAERTEREEAERRRRRQEAEARRRSADARAREEAIRGRITAYLDSLSASGLADLDRDVFADPGRGRPTRGCSPASGARTSTCSGGTGSGRPRPPGPARRGLRGRAESRVGWAPPTIHS